MLRVDLHTHSIASADGGLSIKDYESVLRTGKLNIIAVTDHNRIDFAEKLHATIGDAIIIGEEISTVDGEIIGLYLTSVVPAGQSAEETVHNIRDQGGLVYIPHPFETARKGITAETLNRIAGLVDIIETFNGRTLQNRGALARKWATDNTIPGASSSDAHGPKGWGRTATIVETG